jgi:hypothetical protein
MSPESTPKATLRERILALREFALELTNLAAAVQNNVDVPVPTEVLDQPESPDAPLSVIASDAINYLASARKTLQETIGQVEPRDRSTGAAAQVKPF